eukprot:3772111-Pleurochrysis_carterae.AAC.3
MSTQAPVNDPIRSLKKDSKIFRGKSNEHPALSCLESAAAPAWTPHAKCHMSAPKCKSYDGDGCTAKRALSQLILGFGKEVEAAQHRAGSSGLRTPPAPSLRPSTAPASRGGVVAVVVDHPAGRGVRGMRSYLIE